MTKSFVLFLFAGSFLFGCSSDGGKDDPNNLLNNANNSNNTTNNATNNLNNTTNNQNNDPGYADTSEYYQLDRVLQVEIEIPAEDWDLLRNETRTLADILAGDCLGEPPDDVWNWYSATVTIDGTTVENVGVRKKGFLGSLSSSKPSLKIKFDEFVQDQLFEDKLKRVTLNNGRQDPSKLNTCMSYHVFREAGVPAPRCNFAKVFVNGEDYGVYAHVESIKKRLVSQHFDDVDGNLYEGTLSDFRDGWTGSFDKKTNEAEADFSDIQAVADAVASGDFDALGERVDLDAFLTFWAVEVMVGHWDGYAGDRNNFYFYREPEGKFHFIPWGPDSTFRTINNPFLDFPEPQSVMATSVIPYMLYADPTWREAYQTRLQELLDSVWDETALNALVDQMAEIVQTHAHPLEQQPAANDTARLRSYIDTQQAIVEAEIPQSPDWPQAPQDPTLCWEEIGNVDLSFTAVWGTKGAADPLTEGDATVDTFEVRGDTRSFSDVGATAGFADPNGGPPRAEIAFLGLGAADVLDVLVVTVPMALFETGNTVNFATTDASAVLVQLLPPNYNVPMVLGHMPTGEIVLDVADATPTGTTTGTIRGTFNTFGGP